MEHNKVLNGNNNVFNGNNNSGNISIDDLNPEEIENLPAVLALPAVNAHAGGPPARPPIRPNRATAGNQSNKSEEEIWDEDRLLPLANITSTMRRVLPADAGVPSDVAELVQRGTSDFILLVTCQAKERCRQEGRQKVKVDDMIWALKKLGFADYVAPLELYYSRYQGMRSSDNMASSSMTAQSEPSKKQKEQD